MMGRRAASTMAGDIERDHPDTSAGLAYVQSLGYLTPERVTETPG